MKAYLLKRILWMVPVLFGITLVTFFIIHLAPGDPSDALYRPGEEANRGAVEEFRRNHLLDKPLPVQYWSWLKRLASLDFGEEYGESQQSVRGEIWKRLQVTLPLGAVSLFLAYLFSIPLGILCSIRKNTLLERFLSFLIFSLYSLPVFWVGSLFVVFLCGGSFLKIFPVMGLHGEEYCCTFWDYLPSLLGLRRHPNLPSFPAFLLDLLHHAALPILCLTYVQLAFLSRQMKSGMDEVMNQDFIRTARAKGLKESTVILKHMLRNSLIPLITLLGTLIPALVGGSIIVESIFNIPGMGRYVFEGVLKRDYNIIMAATFISAILTLLGILISDFLYTLVDPGISLEK